MFYKLPFNINTSKQYAFIVGGRGCGRSYFRDYCVAKIFKNEMYEYTSRFNITIKPEEERGFNNLMVKTLLIANPPQKNNA